jgi:dienelactone hydrolase
VVWFLGLLLVRGVQAEPPAGLTFSPTKVAEQFKFEYKPDEAKEPIVGYVAFPKGIGPFRTVIVNHGSKGTAAQVAYNYFPGFLNRGYAVMAADLKYDKKAEESDWEEMFRRLSACIDILQHDERFDGKKVFMFGNGPGAMVTLAYAAQTDKLQAVGMTGGGLVPKDGVKYEKITAPMILVHGAKDETVPLDAAMQLKANLERAGKTVEMKVFEGSGHEVITLKAGDVYDAIVAFFNKNTK